MLKLIVIRLKTSYCIKIQQQITNHRVAIGLIVSINESYVEGWGGYLGLKATIK